MTTTSYTLSEWLNYLSKEEIDALKELARSLPTNNPIAVNIGAGAGTSGLALLESREDLYLVTIDKDEGNTHTGSIEGEVNALTGSNINWKARTQHIVGLSAEIGRHWNMWVSMVFVDGDHSYEGCKADIEAWLPHIRTGGIIAFHDYQKSKWPDVRRVVDEMMTHKEQIANVGRMVAYRVSAGPSET